MVNYEEEQRKMERGMMADERRMLARQAALLPIEGEIETQKTKRNQRDPIDQFAITEGALQKGSAMEEKIRTGSGLSMGGIFQLGQQSQQFMGQAFNMYSTKQAKDQGGLSQQKWQSHADMVAARANAEAQSKAAGMGMMGGILGSALGSDWFAGLDMFK